MSEIKKTIYLPSDYGVQEIEVSYEKEQLKKKFLCNYMINEINKSLSPSFNLSEYRLQGEIFKKLENSDIEVSNLGRVKVNKKICKQNIGESCNYWKLYADEINEVEGIREDKCPIHRLAAKVWLGDAVKNNVHRDVHHITNNAYDNSAANLIYLTESEHSDIHPFKDRICNYCPQKCKNAIKEKPKCDAPDYKCHQDCEYKNRR